MLQEILTYIGSLDTTYIYLVLFFFAFIENIFPPSPSDVVVVIGASLIASTGIEFLPVLFITSIGSALGFILMYYVGFYLSEHILRKGKVKFISPESIQKTDRWFAKYGYWLILANRFMPGTRSVISFFSGLYELHMGKTFVNALISAFLWNTVIIFMGIELGNNAEKIDYYFTTYSNVVIGITFVIAAFFISRYILSRKKR